MTSTATLAKVIDAISNLKLDPVNYLRIVGAICPPLLQDHLYPEPGKKGKKSRILDNLEGNRKGWAHAESRRDGIKHQSVLAAVRDGQRRQQALGELWHRTLLLAVKDPLT
jgi:hypothetical protein